MARQSAVHCRGVIQPNGGRGPSAPDAGTRSRADAGLRAARGARGTTRAARVQVPKTPSEQHGARFARKGVCATHTRAATAQGQERAVYAQDPQTGVRAAAITALRQQKRYTLTPDFLAKKTIILKNKKCYVSTFFALFGRRTYRSRSRSSLRLRARRVSASLRTASCGVVFLYRVFRVIPCCLLLVPLSTRRAVARVLEFAVGRCVFGDDGGSSLLHLPARHGGR